MRRHRWLVFVAALGVAGCGALLGLPDRELDDQVDSSFPIPVEAAIDTGVVDTSMPPEDGGVDTSVPIVCDGSCPVAAYDFDEGAGTTAKDNSANKNDGTLKGAVTWAAGKSGQAVNFAGGLDYVDFKISSSLDIAGSNITIAFWIFVSDTVARDQAIVSKPWANGTMSDPYYQYGVEFITSSKQFAFFLGTPAAGARKLTIPAGPTSTWTHVAFTYDGTNQRGYINGTQVGISVTSGPIVARTTPFRLGVDALNSQGFVGRLDALRIYDKTLTAAEIIALRDGL